MGAFTNLIDAILFFFFLIIAIFAPLIDSQSVLPIHLYPKFLVDLKSIYIREFDDYLVTEKPHFFVGLIWVELIFQWPLAVASLYGILTRKSWVRTTCLIYGASVFTAMVSILSEMLGSGKASENFLMMYYPFLGLALLAILRGLLPHSNKATLMGKRAVLNRKKRV